MATSSQWQAALDRFLMRNGGPATLQRISGGNTMSASLTMVFRTDVSAREIAPGSGITQEDSRIIISSSDLRASGWIGGAPRRGDRIIIHGIAMPMAVLQATQRAANSGYNVVVRG